MPIANRKHNGYEGRASKSVFYTRKKISDEAKPLYGLFRTDTTLVKYAAQMTFEGPKGFWEHEQYTMMNLRQGIQDLRSKKLTFTGSTEKRMDSIQ
ncbi:MAG: hypothetical protein IPI22_09000 [Bacteroidetes bacterium]|nr:hypothetical protein [Bacteroidota bacterium]